MKTFPGLSVRWLTQNAPDVMKRALNLWDSDMSEVMLGYRNVKGLVYNKRTRFSDTYDPQAHGMRLCINVSDLEKELGYMLPLTRRQMVLRIYLKEANNLIEYPTCERDFYQNSKYKYDPVRNEVININSLCMTPDNSDTVILITTLHEGEIIRFGNYEWYILKNNVAERKLLLMVTSRVADLPLHDKREKISWKDSSLRKWLNEDFIKEFSETERKRIVETENDDFGIISRDKIFILSKAEYDEYMDLRDNPTPYLISRTVNPDSLQFMAGYPSSPDDEWLDIDQPYLIYPALWLSY